MPCRGIERSMLFSRLSVLESPPLQISQRVGHPPITGDAVPAAIKDGNGAADIKTKAEILNS